MCRYISHSFFWKNQGGFESYLRNFLNFAKNGVLSRLSNVDNMKKFYRAVYEL